MTIAFHHFTRTAKHPPSRTVQLPLSLLALRGEAGPVLCSVLEMLRSGR
jgi:hypothetical protein